MKKSLLFTALAIAMLSSAGSDVSIAQKRKKEDDNPPPFHEKSDGLLKIMVTLDGTKTPALIFINDYILSTRKCDSIGVFLHGDNPSNSNIHEISDRHNLTEQISFLGKSSEKRKSCIWIAPWSSGKCDDFKKTFTDRKRTDMFFESINREVAKVGVSISKSTRIVIAGQSRARIPIANLISLSPVAMVSEVYLFDALFDHVDTFDKFAINGGRIWVVYGEATLGGAKKMYRDLNLPNMYHDQDLASNIKHIYTPEPDPDEYMKTGSLAKGKYEFTQENKKSNIGFVSSSVEHRYTARYYFAAVLS